MGANNRTSHTATSGTNAAAKADAQRTPNPSGAQGIAQKPPLANTIITGEKGALVCDTLTADLTFYANGTASSDWDEVRQFRGVTEGDVVRYAIAKPEPLRTEHEAFRDAVLGKAADIVTLEQGVRIVEVAEAVLRSAATGSTVDLTG